MTSSTTTPATSPGDRPLTSAVSPAGGTAATRGWHRVGFGALAVALVGLGWGAHALVQRPPAPTAHVASDDHGAAAGAPPAPTPTVAPAPGARVVIDRASVENIGQLERDTAAVLAAGGTGDVTALRTDFNRVFQQCTTTGAEHDALHGFLAPVADALARVEATSGADRRDAVRTLLHRLGQFDAGFAPAP